MPNGSAVAEFERRFAEYVGARFAIALCNGTATLHTALVALGVKPGDRVAVPPLTMASTTIAVLQAGAVPVFCDVDPDTWLKVWRGGVLVNHEWSAEIPVSLYGLHTPVSLTSAIDDAAQTLRPHSGCAFTSYSFQASKILALGEGGMLVTNDEALATRARQFSSLGYDMRPDQPRIDPAVLKSPDYARHHLPVSWNYRMNDLTAREALLVLPGADLLLAARRASADLYRQAVAGCSWITPQYVPEGWSHDMWSYAVALESADLWHPFVDAIERHCGERAYAAWRLTYQEPAFQHLSSVEREVEDWTGRPGDIERLPIGICPIAESLQPRLVCAQTNNLASAERNAEAWRKAIKEVGG